MAVHGACASQLPPLTVLRRVVQFGMATPSSAAVQAGHTGASSTERRLVSSRYLRECAARHGFCHGARVLVVCRFRHGANGARKTPARR